MSEFHPIQSSEIENNLLSEVEKYSFLYMFTSMDVEPLGGLETQSDEK